MKVKDLKVSKFAEMFQRVADLLSPEYPIAISEHTNVTSYHWCYVFVSSELVETIVSKLKWYLAYPEDLICFVVSKSKEEVVRELQEAFEEEIELEEVVL